MLLSGTLADLDLPGIAAMTSLGRASLRLELRASGGDLIGSLVLKAGRVVSATAGAAHGRDALRVLLSSASDARFEVAHEPLDFALSSSVASLEELGELRRAPGLPPVRRATTELGATATGVGPAPTDHARITAFAMARAERPVMEGALSEFDLPTLLHTIGCSRKFCALEIGDGQTTHGTIYVKSGIVVAAIAGPFTGIPAVQHLIASHRGGRFRLVQLAGEVPDDAPLGPIGQVLLHVDAPAPAGHAASAAVAASGTALTATALDERTRPLLPADTVADTVIEDRSRPAPPADAVVMEGKLSELDVRTVLEVLAATRQHARLYVVASGQRPVGEVTLRSGWIISCRTGALRGRDALVSLLAAPPECRFHVVTLAEGPEHEETIGAIRDVLRSIPIAPVVRVETSTRILRWAIPLSFVVGGAIVLFVTRGGSTGRSIAPQAAPVEAVAPPRGEPQTGPTATSQPGPGGAAQSAPAAAQSGAAAAAQTGSAGSSPGGPAGAAQHGPASTAQDGPAGTAQGAPVGSSQHGPTGSSPTGPAGAGQNGTASTAQNGPAGSAQNGPAGSAQNGPTGSAQSGAAATSASGPAAAASPRAPAPPVPSGVSIKNAQAAFKQLGYDPGPIDNVYGRATRNAVMRFQRAQHLPVTGILDEQTWSAIVGQLVPQRGRR